MEELATEIIDEIFAGEYCCDRDMLKELVDKVDKLRTDLVYMYNHFHDDIEE